MSADARHEGAAQASTQPSSPSPTPPAAAAAVAEAAAPAKAGVAPAEAPPGFRWASEPTLEDKGRRFYAAFDAGSLRYSLGDVVYLWPAEHGALPFVAHLESLHEQLPGKTGTDAAGQEAAPPGSKWAGLRWFYRPSEVDVDGPFKAEDHELFWADEYALCPLEAVCGKCAVLTPAQADRRPGSTAAHPRGSDVFVCSRKYLPDERRIVPLDDGVTGVTVAAALQDKPFEVVDGRIVQQPPTAADKAAARPRPKRVRGAGSGDQAAAGSLDNPAADEADEAAQPGGEEQPAQDLAAPSTIDPQQPPVKRRRHEQEHRQEL